MTGLRRTAGLLMAAFATLMLLGELLWGGGTYDQELLERARRKGLNIRDLEIMDKYILYVWWGGLVLGLWMLFQPAKRRKE